MLSRYRFDSLCVCNTSRCDLALVRWAARRSAAKLLTKDEADKLPHGQLLAYEGALGNSTSPIELSTLS